MRGGVEARNDGGHSHLHFHAPSPLRSHLARLVATFSMRFAWLLAITEWSVIYTQSWFTTPKLGAEFSPRRLAAPRTAPIALLHPVPL